MWNSSAVTASACASPCSGLMGRPSSSSRATSADRSVGSTSPGCDATMNNSRRGEPKSCSSVKGTWSKRAPSAANRVCPSLVSLIPNGRRIRLMAWRPARSFRSSALECGGGGFAPGGQDIRQVDRLEMFDKCPASSSSIAQGSSVSSTGTAIFPIIRRMSCCSNGSGRDKEGQDVPGVLAPLAIA